MPELEVAQQIKLTPSKRHIHYQDFCQALAPLATLETFPMLFCFLAEAQYAQAAMISTALGSASFAMFAAIVAQGVEFSIDDFTKASIAAAAPKNIVKVMDMMVLDPIFSKYGRVITKINEVSYLSVGFTQAQAKCLQTAIRMSDVSEGFNLFLMEEEVELAKTRSIINSAKFAHCISSNEGLGPMTGVMPRIKEVKEFLAKLLTYEEMALFLAVYLNQSDIGDESLKWLEALDISTGPLNALAIVYTSEDIDDAREVMELDTQHLDPWDLTEKDPEYKGINVHLKNSTLRKKINPLYSSDKFSRNCVAIHKYASQRRVVRENSPIQDALSKKRSMVTHTDIASRLLRGQLAGVKKVHAYLSVASIYGNVVNGLVNVVQFPHLFLNCDHAKHNEVIGDNHLFVADLKKHNEVLIVDNLNFEQSLTSDEKIYMTHEANRDKIYAALKILEDVVGFSYNARASIKMVPGIIVWRTIIPYFVSLAERFDLVVNRLDTYYHIRYCPPINPHEPQCTLYMVRRKAIMHTTFVVHDRVNFPRNQPPEAKRVRARMRDRGPESHLSPPEAFDDSADVASDPLADDPEMGIGDLEPLPEDDPEAENYYFLDPKPLDDAGYQKLIDSASHKFPLPCRDAVPVQVVDQYHQPLPMPGEVKRRANYVIRALDIHRFFHGIVYRDIVFQGRYSLPITVMLRDYISALLFAQPLPDVGHYFNVSRFYPIDVKQDAKEDVIKYLSLGGHGGNKSKKKGAAKKDIQAGFADNIGNYAREFQGAVVNSDMEF
jgi:hypothetical protein